MTVISAQKFLSYLYRSLIVTLYIAGCVTGQAGSVWSVSAPRCLRNVVLTPAQPGPGTDQSEASMATWRPIRGRQCGAHTQSRMPGYQASLCSAQNRERRRKMSLFNFQKVYSYEMSQYLLFFCQRKLQLQFVCRKKFLATRGCFSVL